ncbi:MAG: hypothetical protein WDO18_06720 [Acidobacteriota bacterium]
MQTSAGHWTSDGARLLLHRDAFPFDFDAIAATASRKNVLLEINASPERLDLTASLAPRGQGSRCEVRDLDGRASSEAFGEHALRGDHGAAGRGWNRRTS